MEHETGAERYQRLRLEAESHWRETQRERRAKFETMNEQLAQSDDWVSRPRPDTDWSSPGIVHSCGGSVFQIPHGGWVVLNGVRYRWSGVCQGCKASVTYDWATKEWL